MIAEHNIKRILKPLDSIASRGHHISSVFRDFISLALYALCREEELYLEVMGRYKNDRPKGKREADYFAHALSELLIVTSEENHDVLGDAYMHIAGNYSAKNMGQYFSPHGICDMMADITIGETDKQAPTVIDPACGSGRMLISAAKKLKPEAHFTGIDLDRVCAQMAALNLCLFNMNGIVYHGNGLSLKMYDAYMTQHTALGGRVQRLTDEELEACTRRDGDAIQATSQKTAEPVKNGQAEPQLTLF